MDEAEYRALVTHDERHWWYRGRRRVINAQLERLDLRRGGSVLDAGCGSGRTMDDLARWGSVAGFDLNELGVEHARARGHEDVRLARVEEIPWPDDSFDLITCLDVLEHTPDDVGSLRELLRVARPGATLLATVPAYKLLWSAHDVANHHYRRYRRGQLVEAGRTAGWEPVTATYFNSILLAPAAAVRLVARRPGRRARSQIELTPRALDRVLELPMRAEAAAIRRGVRLPAGLSLMAVFR
ncbi:MAG: class I SAM-dependent methyltransferase, partial [Actinomycetota bacterium]|nr:class I SAM-dependent methyltransferase [Actinomycetota bacterium]